MVGFWVGWVLVFYRLFLNKYIMFGGFWGCCCSSTVLRVHNDPTYVINHSF